MTRKDFVSLPAALVLKRLGFPKYHTAAGIYFVNFHDQDGKEVWITEPMWSPYFVNDYASAPDILTALDWMEEQQIIHGWERSFVGGAGASWSFYIDGKRLDFDTPDDLIVGVGKYKGVAAV